jgi:energy-coupling factor transporter transmembrane protein EcfT
MELALIYLLIILGVVVILNFVASYVVWSTYFEVKERRLYQIIFVWFVPLLGAFTVIYINREDSFKGRHLNKVGNNPGQTPYS